MAGKWLPAAELTGSGRPVLRPAEIECSLLSSVDLESEENPNFPLLKSGLLVLTTHRLIWIPDAAAANSSPAAAAAAAAIPLAAVAHIFSAKKSIKSMFASPRVRFQASATPEGRVDERGSRSIVITLVSRGKSDGISNSYKELHMIGSIELSGTLPDPNHVSGARRTCTAWTAMAMHSASTADRPSTRIIKSFR